MALVPVTIYGNPFTASETTFLQGFADLTHTRGDVFFIGATGQVSRLVAGLEGQVLTTHTNASDPTWTTIAGSGTVTTVSVATANGFSGTVTNATTTPAITIVAGAIVPTSVNGNTITTGTGTLTLNTFTLTVSGTASITGTNTGDQTITLTGAITGSGTGSIATTIATPGTLTVATANSTATAHTHAITTSSAPGAAASILATDASGIIGSTGTRIVKGWFTDLTVTNAIAGSVTGAAGSVAVGGITGLGTGVATALAVNVGSAGAPVVNGGALGTPSSGTLTNATGLPIAGLVASTSTAIGVGSIELGNASDTTISRSAGGVIAVEGVVIPSISSTNTITNKRNQPRTASSTTASTLTPDLSTANVYFRTTQTAGLTINSPTGTPVIGETIAIYVDSAGAQTLTMDTAYKVFGTAFPASTTAGKTLMIVAQYNGTDWKTTWVNAV